MELAVDKEDAYYRAMLARALDVHSKDAIARVSPWRGYAAILLWGEHVASDQTKSPALTQGKMRSKMQRKMK